MKLEKTETKANIWGQLIPTNPPVKCPDCGRPLIMQGFLYWCTSCGQGWKNMDWEDYKEEE